MKPYAVFDLDGTLIRWQLFHVIVDRLGKTGRIDKESYQEILDSRMAWKRREQPDGFDKYQIKLIEAYNSVVIDLSQEELEELATRAFEEHKDQCYVFTRNLMKELKARGYMLFAISGSFTEVVQLIAKHYGFDDSAGTMHAKVGGKFTGEIDVIQYERKVDMLNDLKNKYQLTDKDSYAVGDSMGDYAILKHVQNPIVFNPARELFKKAQEHGWKIVVERKNVIYEMSMDGHNYIVRANV
jgi:HAD superfamily hydrolase (TIGR01490 family)